LPLPLLWLLSLLLLLSLLPLPLPLLSLLPLLLLLSLLPFPPSPACGASFASPNPGGVERGPGGEVAVAVLLSGTERGPGGETAVAFLPSPAGRGPEGTRAALHVFLILNLREIQNPMQDPPTTCACIYGGRRTRRPAASLQTQCSLTTE